MGYPIQLSTSTQNILFLLISSTDHVTGATGKTPTVTLSKNGAAFGSPTGSVTEIANGWYQVAGNATDSNTAGPLALHATATGCDPYDDLFMVVAYNPLDSVRLGLTALPNAAAAASGGLPTVGATIPNATAGASGGLFIAGTNAATTITTGLTTTFTGNLSGNVTGSVGSVTGAVGSVTGAVGSVTSAVTVTGTPAVNVTTWNGTAVAAPNVAGYPLVDVGKWIGGTIPAVNVTGVPKVDVLDWLGTTVTAGAIPAAAAGASGGILISGTNSGTTTLGALTITGATTHTGNVQYSGTTTFVGAVAAQAGVAITNSTTNGAGLSITGNGTAAGISSTGGSTSGIGILATGGATNGAGVSFVGTGSGSGFSIAGGATGLGLAITTTANDGLSILPTGGNAIVATANGTSKHGMVLQGAGAGTSDGLKCIAGTGGVDIRGNQVGNVTGNLSGSVGSVTGSVGSVTSGVTVTTNNDKTGYTVSTVSDKTGYALSSAGLDSVSIEAGSPTLNARQSIEICTAALAGLVAGAGTTSVTIYGAGLAASAPNARITATVDTVGNRSGVTINP